MTVMGDLSTIIFYKSPIQADAQIVMSASLRGLMPPKMSPSKKARPSQVNILNVTRMRLFILFLCYRVPHPHMKHGETRYRLDSVVRPVSGLVTSG